MHPSLLNTWERDSHLKFLSNLVERRVTEPVVNSSIQVATGGFPRGHGPQHVPRINLFTRDVDINS